MEFFSSVRQAAEEALKGDDGTFSAMVSGVAVAGEPAKAEKSADNGALASKTPEELRALVTKLVKLNKGTALPVSSRCIV